MRSTHFFKLSALFILPFLLLGCFEEHATQFHLDDANQVEWAPPDPSSSSLSYTAELDADQIEPVTIELEVQLIGAQTDSDRMAGVIVSETDADEGVHFELLSNDVLIPANSNHGMVEVQVLSENIANGESYSVLLELQETSELGVAVNMKDMDLSIEKDDVE